MPLLCRMGWHRWRRHQYSYFDKESRYTWECQKCKGIMEIGPSAYF